MKVSPPRLGIVMEHQSRIDPERRNEGTSRRRRYPDNVSGQFRLTETLERTEVIDRGTVAATRKVEPDALHRLNSNMAKGLSSLWYSNIRFRVVACGSHKCQAAI
jgi:hypothetical protein